MSILLFLIGAFAVVFGAGLVLRARSEWRAFWRATIGADSRHVRLSASQKSWGPYRDLWGAYVRGRVVGGTLIVIGVLSCLLGYFASAAR